MGSHKHRGISDRHPVDGCASQLEHLLQVAPVDVLESEEESIAAKTKDGSLDWHGRPAIKGQTGGWGCAVMILVNFGLTTMAFAAVEVNLVLFAKSVLRQTNAEAANTFSRWSGTMFMSSLAGAFLSDSFLGGFKTCVIFQVVMAIGLLSTTLCTQLFLIKPQGCGKIRQPCDPHSPLEVALLYISIYAAAIGNGAPEPSLAAFGADQFDGKDPKEKQSKSSFYRYFYVALNLGFLVSQTLLVYIENLGHWVPVFWLCTIFSVVASTLLLVRMSMYRYFEPAGKPLLSFCQVIMASIRKMEVEVPPDGEGLYELVDVERELRNGSRKISHTEGFKFLDRAAVVTEVERIKGLTTVNPWRLCTTTQVEEVKAILRLMPIWLCMIIPSMVFAESVSLFVEQGAAMDTQAFSNFHVPPASMTTFDIVTTSAFILLYDKLIVPLVEKVTKRELKQLSELKRIGIGLGIAVVAMVVAGFMEQRRLAFAFSSGEEKSSLSIFWQIPQYVLAGVSEAFVLVARMEFFSSQSPESMKSIGIGLSMSSSAIGYYVCSMILSLVMDVTSRNGKPGWVPSNLNDGHLDRFFFLSAALVAINLGVFIVCSKRYKPRALEKPEEEGETTA